MNEYEKAMLHRCRVEFETKWKDPKFRERLIKQTARSYYVNMTLNAIRYREKKLFNLFGDLVEFKRSFGTWRLEKSTIPKFALSDFVKFNYESAPEGFYVGQIIGINVYGKSVFYTIDIKRGTKAASIFSIEEDDLTLMQKAPRQFYTGYLVVDNFDIRDLREAERLRKCGYRYGINRRVAEELKLQEDLNAMERKILHFE